MQFQSLDIQDVKLIKPNRIGDSRGYFSETFKQEWFREHIEDVGFVQENESLSSEVGTVRGLHFQKPPFAQGKLVRCVRGALLDVAVDIRRGSPTYGKWVSAELSEEDGEQLWVPVGFAHGFMTLAPNTVINYKVTAPYSAKDDCGVKWNDLSIGIKWPVMENYVISAKDTNQPNLVDLVSSFEYRGI